MPSAKSAHTVGIVFILLAALLWSLNGWLIKVLNDDGRGPGGVTIAFYRSLFAGLFLWPLARGRFHTLGTGRASKPIADQGHRHAERAAGKNNTTGRAFVLFRPSHALRPAAFAGILFFALMTACFVVANTMTKASNAIILQYTSTFWVFSLSPFILKERPLVRELPILLLAMGGVAIIFFGEAETDLVGLIVALLAGLFYGLLTMTLRQMRDSHAAAVTVVNNLGAAVLLLPVVVLLDGGLAVTLNALLLLILMGAVQLGLPYYLFSRGLEHVPAHRAAMVTLAEPVLVPVWTYLALGETVPPVTMLGGGIILFALAVFFGRLRRVRRHSCSNPQQIARTTSK